MWEGWNWTESLQIVRRACKGDDDLAQDVFVHLAKFTHHEPRLAFWKALRAARAARARQNAEREREREATLTYLLLKRN